MIPLPVINASAFVIGSKTTIDVSKMISPAGPANPRQPLAAVLIDNESSCTIDAYSSIAQLDHTLIPANRFGVVMLPPGETSVILTITNVYPQYYTATINPYFINPGETIPEYGNGGATGGAQAGNQQRNVAVPVGPFINGQEQLTITAPADFDINSTNLSPANIANNAVFGYLYGLYVHIQIPTTGNVSANFSLRAVVCDGSATVLVTTDVLLDTVFAVAGTVKQFDLFPAYPGEIFLHGFGGTAVTFRWRLHVISASVTVKPSLDFGGLTGVDGVNTQAIGSIGSYVPQGGTF